MKAELPAGWAWARIAAIADTQLGKTLSTKQAGQGRSMPYLRNKNVQWHRVDLDDIRETCFTPADEEKFKLQRGDLLVCEGGEVGRCAVWQQPREQIYFQNALHRIRPHSGISTRWLEYILRWYAESDRLSAHTSGVTISHLVQRALRQLEIPVAPSPEQHRVVTAIEEHFCRLDAADASLDVAEARCQALTRSVLVGSIPMELPESWKLTIVAEAGETGLGRQRSPKYHKGTNMKPYLRVANVFEDRIDTSSIMEMHFDEAEFEKYRLREGDILLNEGQSPELLGRPAIYRGEPPRVAFTNSLIRFVPGPGVIPEWALLVFRRHMHARRFMRESRITTNIAHLALGRFRTVEFPIPPLDTQHELVASTRAALTSIDQVIVQIHRTRAKITAVRRALLAAAFSGRLVPPDPNDEPAAVLLERIAAARRTTPKRQRVSA